MNDTIVSSSNDVEWLKILREDTTEIVHGKMTLNISRNTYSVSWSECKRKFTDEEFRRFLAITPNCIVEPINTRSGFGFGLRLYDEPPRITPGLSLKPTFVFYIDGYYFPEGVKFGFESEWSILSPFSHNPRNTALLLEYGFDSPREKTYYEY